MGLDVVGLGAEPIDLSQLVHHPPVIRFHRWKLMLVYSRVIISTNKCATRPHSRVFCLGHGSFAQTPAPPSAPIQSSYSPADMQLYAHPCTRVRHQLTYARRKSLYSCCIKDDMMARSSPSAMANSLAKHQISEEGCMAIISLVPSLLCCALALIVAVKRF